MTKIPTLTYDSELQCGPVRVALVWGLGLPGCPRTATFPAYLSDLLAKVRSAGEKFWAPGRKQAVRAMLRFGSYKPSGRSKPSSEYLFAAALAHEFPLVNPPVDVNNAVSLQWGFPASIFDLELCSPALLLRRGMAGESYVFNQSGQSIDLEDLICVCRAESGVWVPFGNPVKDSVATKVKDSTRNVIAVIYAPAAEPITDLEGAAAHFAELLAMECGASAGGWSLP